MLISITPSIWNAFLGFLHVTTNSSYFTEKSTLPITSSNYKPCNFYDVPRHNVALIYPTNLSSETAAAPCTLPLTSREQCILLHSSNSLICKWHLASAWLQVPEGHPSQLTFLPFSFFSRHRPFRVPKKHTNPILPLPMSWGSHSNIFFR